MNLETHPSLHFWHRGEAGDIIYSWFFISCIGNPPRYTTKGPSNHGSFDQHAALKPLADLQPYLRSFNRHDVQTSDMEDLRQWIDGKAPTDGPNIIKPYFKGYNIPWPGYKPWLFGVPGPDSVTQIKNLSIETGAYAVINVTARAKDPNHRWGEFLPAGDMVFLGLGSEYDDFQRHLAQTGYQDASKRVKYVWTDHFLDAASIISGANAYYGNTSACLAIAQGLGHPHIYVAADPCNDNTSLFGHEVVLNKARIPWLRSLLGA